MAGDRTGGGLREALAEVVRRKRREAEDLVREGETAAQAAYDEAKRTGVNVLLQAGIGLPGDRGSRATPSSVPVTTRSRTSNTPPTTTASPGRDGTWLDRSTAAKGVGGSSSRLGIWAYCPASREAAGTWRRG